MTMPKHKSNGSDSKELVRMRFQKALEYAKKNGYIAQLEVAFPSTKRQPIILRDIYLHAIDNSDQLYCACCGNQYEVRQDSFRGTVPKPIDWCRACREARHDMPMDVLLAKHEPNRRGKEIEIQRSINQIYKWINEYAMQKCH
jgi:hypothetical protein